MSYIDKTKKEAKKLLSLLKGKSTEELKTLTNYSNKDLENILAISKGFLGVDHMHKELANPTINENNTIINSIFQFTKDDVVNEIYPEYKEDFTFREKCKENYTSQKNIEHNVVKFMGENIKSLNDRNILFCEKECIEQDKLIKNIDGILLIDNNWRDSSMSIKSNKKISVYKNHKPNCTIDPLNPLLNNISNLDSLFPFHTYIWLAKHLSEKHQENKIIKLKSFKGFLNLNYLISVNDESIKKYLETIGFKGTFDEEVIKKHIFYSREALIFAQIMIDFEHCFSDEPTFKIEPNINKDNITISISEKNRLNNEEKSEELYQKASEIMKNCIFNQIYSKNKDFKCPYSLIVLSDVTYNENQYPSKKNTIVLKKYSLLEKIDENFDEIVIDLPKDSTGKKLSLNIKKFIIDSSYYEAISSKRNCKVYIGGKNSIKGKKLITLDSLLY